MKAFDRFGVLSVMGMAHDPIPSSIKPSPGAVIYGDMETLNPAVDHAPEMSGARRSRTLLSGMAQSSFPKAAPFLGARGPAVGPVRPSGAPAYGQRSTMGQKSDVTCEKTPDGGAVCSDGTFQAPGCGDPKLIASAAPTGSVEAKSSLSSAVPLIAGVGILGIAAYFFLR